MFKRIKDFVRGVLWRRRKEAIYNSKPVSSKEILSPSGKYNLVISTFDTGPGHWNYSQGEVFHINSKEPIATIRRNYGSFPYLFVDDHPNGHSYLLAGEDYQGQTVIELDTGIRKDYLPDSAKKGFGFCWADYKFDPATMILTVDGCFWAADYEFKFFDFSDPINGWPELVMEGAYALADDKWPIIHPDGTIVCFDTSFWDDDLEPEEEEEMKKNAPTKSIKTFKRDGNKLILLNEWLSEEEKNRREDYEKYDKKNKEEIANFKTTDPLYKSFSTYLQNPALSPESYESYGHTYDGWCPDFHGDERRWCRRIINKPKKLVVDLEWAIVSGPIKLVIYKKGNHVEDKFFEHSAMGMLEAFEYALNLVK